MRDWFNKQVVMSSTPDSIAGGKISLLAIAEIIFAVWAYWAIAIYFETHLYILISVIAAPLLLFRSDDSCDTAAKWWAPNLNLWNDESEEAISRLFSRRKVIFWLLHVFVTFAALYLFSCSPWGWIDHDVGVVRYLRACAAGLIAWYLAETALLLLAAAIVLFQTRLAVGGLIQRITLELGERRGGWVLVMVVLMSMGGEGSVLDPVDLDPDLLYEYGIPSTISGVLEVILAMAVFLSIMLFLMIGITVTLPAVATSMFLMSILIRLTSIIVNAQAGFGQWRANWNRTMLSEDICHETALVPGIGEAGWQLKQISGEFEFKWCSFSHNIFVVSMALLIWIPAQLWRWSIKSTCWFYGPLYLLLCIGAEEDPNRRRHALAASAGLREWAAMLYAAFVLLIAIISIVEWGPTIEQWKRIGNAAPLWWFETNFSDIVKRPWQWFQLPAAVLALVCFFWLDHLHRRRNAAIALGDSPDSYYSLDAHPGRTIYRLQRIKQWLVTAAMFIGIWCFGKWAYQFGGLPKWIKDVLGTFFGS